MNQPAVFQGTFSDVRTVKGRKIVQLIIEVPQELGNTALQALGGLPDPVNPVWVAVARLDAKPAPEPKQLAGPPIVHGKRQKTWDDLSPAQQAAIRCHEPEFQRFLDEQVCRVQGWNAPQDESEAAQIVRHVCKVESRSELNQNEQAAILWKRLDGEFWAWSRGYHG